MSVRMLTKCIGKREYDSSMKKVKREGAKVTLFESKTKNQRNPTK